MPRKSERGKASTRLARRLTVTVEALRRAESVAKQAVHAQSLIVRTQQEMAHPEVGYDQLMDLVCERARELTGADGGLAELIDGGDRAITRFTTPGHAAILGAEVALTGTFTGDVVRGGDAMLCADCHTDPRVDQALARRAGAAAMIAAPIRVGEDVIGVLKVVSARSGIFQPSDVANLQVLAESLRVVLQRLQAERRLARVHRAQHLLSLSNLAQARLEDEDDLLREICRLAVDIGGYREAWVVYAAPGDPNGFRRIAHATHSAHAPVQSETPADEADCEPAIEALKRGEMRVYETLPDDAAWALEARLAGIRNAIFLPLLRGPSAFGVLCLYGAEPDSFGIDEQQALQDMAGDLAFGIRHIRSQHEKRRLEQAVIAVAAGVSASNATELFERLCASMAEALGASMTTVARVVRHDGHPRVRTLSALVAGRVIPNLEFDCRDTPFEALLENDEIVIADGLEANAMTRAMGIAGAQACVGRRLVDARDLAVGMLIVMWDRPLQNVDFVSSMLRIFATRAASELERRQAEVRLREQASLLDQAKDAIVLRGMDGRIRYWNKGAERVYGWTAADALGERISPPLDEDPGVLATALRQVATTGEWRGTMHQRHKDGRIVPTDAHWTLVADSLGQPQSILGINTDISHRLAVEAQLRQSQRLESLGQLTGGVAHDFNNLLTVILGNAELLVEQLDANAGQQELAEMIRSAAQRGADLTNRLLAFARRQNLNPQRVDARTLISGMAALLRRAVPEKIEIARDTAADLWACLADAAQLEAAILNLCLNARDAMPRGGRLLIEARNERVGADEPRVSEEFPPGDYVRIIVSDTGIGIAPEDLPRVLEPFFTTKAVGKGTGLGLSMVYGFVKQSRGHLVIQSQPGRGTSVILYLPRALGREEAASVPRRSPARGTESILLVEDDPLVRRFAEDQLRNWGYDVIAVPNGDAALTVLSTGVHVDLLFTDVVMPGGLAGPELVEEARRMRPGLRALYSSGYSEGALDDLPPARAAPLLSKPYQRAELAEMVRAALEDRAH